MFIVILPVSHLFYSKNHPAMPAGQRVAYWRKYRDNQTFGRVDHKEIVWWWIWMSPMNIRAI
jgi:hypothetical protein